MRRFVLSSLALVLLSGESARAQPAPAAPPPAPAPPPAAPPAGPVLVPPKLKQFAEATYPPEALAQGLTARVELQLTIAPDGTVTEAGVLAPVGNGFDEAALEAGKRLLFEPATKDGVPIAARVVFPYVFEIKIEAPPPPPPQAPPKPARFEGRTLDADDDEPIGQVTLEVESADGSIKRQVKSDATGAFAIEELPAGAYHVRLRKPEWLEQEADETLTAGEATTVVYRMLVAPDPDAFRAVARVPPPPREVTRRSISREELTRIPGTRGDALRTVELLPGVARPPMGAGLLIVRGSAPTDTQVMLEGVPVPLLYHFGGLTSFINSRLLESVDFYPGNFSTRYGRRRGGIVEAGLADPPRDALHGVADLNFIDGSLLVQGPITSNWEFAAAARRSWIDFVFEQVVDAADLQTIAAPVYYDYQALTTYRPGPDDKLRLLLYGSGDSFELLFAQPSDQDAAITGDFDLTTDFHRAHATWSRKISDSVDHDLELAAGTFALGFGLGEAINFSLSGTDIYTRSEWTARVSDSFRLITGIDFVTIPGEVEYAGPPVQQSEGNSNQGPNGTTFSNQDEIEARESFNPVQPAVYVEGDVHLAPVRFVIGARADYYSELDAFSFDPRLSVHYALDRDTGLKSGVGLFSQPPQFHESSPAFGNPKLGPSRTLHVSAGVDRTLGTGVTFGLEGFYKQLYDRVIGTEFGQAPYLKNGGKGRIYGLELLAKVQPRGRFFGYLSYTLSRSERQDRNEGYRLFDFDQPHIVTLSGVYRLGRGWELGGTFRLVSGNPDTPVVGAVLNTNTGLYSPVFGRLNSIRSSYFHRLDVRIEKLWDFEAWKLALYLDVQNVYNATNSEGVIYDFEYRKKMDISGLPIFPNLGLRGEL